MIKSFLLAIKSGDPSEASNNSSSCIDAVIITVAPTIVGTDGIDYTSNLTTADVGSA